MAVKIRTERPDKVLRRIARALDEYAASHPEADVELYRQNSVSVRIRVIAPEFRGRGRAEREDELWQVLDRLPEEVETEISLLLMLTPEEAKTSFANLEFDNPIPSSL